MALRRAGVVVFHKGDRAARPEAEEAGRLAARVAQAAVLAALGRGHEHALGRDVKGGGQTARGVDPVDGPAILFWGAVGNW